MSSKPVRTTNMSSQVVIPFGFIGATFELLKLFAGKGLIIQNLKSKAPK